MNTDDSSTYFGNWACWTNHCHEEHINTPIGLIRALMSIREDREVNFQEAIEYTIKLTETDLETLAKESEGFEFDTCEIGLLFLFMMMILIAWSAILVGRSTKIIMVGSGLTQRVFILEFGSMAIGYQSHS